MRYTTAGESHGPALLAIVSEVPSGFALSTAAIDADLTRRQSGYGRGGRMAIERDTVRILSGLRFGRTLGSPIALQIDNRDWPNWQERMAAEGRAPVDLVREQTPRPGHADLAGVQKTASDDCRDVLERASARESAARVAAGAVAKAWLANFGVEISSYVTRIGTVTLPEELIARKGAVFSTEKIERSELRCPDAQSTEAMKAAIDAARAAGDSLGGWFNVVASGLVPGIGGYAEATQRLDGRLAAALVSIPAIKGVQFGLGFAAGALPGSEVHDPIIVSETDSGRIQPQRATNNAGGLEGGMTNGELLLASCVMKPIPTLTQPLATVDLLSGQRREASRERSDVVAVPAAAVVAEAEVAMVLADAYGKKFGGDNLTDALAAFEHYINRLTARSTSWARGTGER
ncbi:MAG: chorismate synthase [Coriobacteriales bacterium]|jgi:chorismate synthase|nr:chorismate synthase [Coriobacteriales bacterium]